MQEEKKKNEEKRAREIRAQSRGRPDHTVELHAVRYRCTWLLYKIP